MVVEKERKKENNVGMMIKNQKMSEFDWLNWVLEKIWGMELAEKGGGWWAGG